MSKEAAKSFLGWEGIKNGILIAYYMTKKFRVSVTVVYAPVKPTDGDTSDSDEFYVQLQEQRERVPIPVKDRNGATISDQEKVKERLAEHFENVLNGYTVAGKDIDENEKVCDTFDVKEDLFSERELATALKGLKNNNSLVAESVINEFLKYGGSEVKKKLLKIMNMTFENGEVTNDFRKTLIKPLGKEGDKSECRNYQGIRLASIGSKLPINMRLFRLKDAVDKVLREGQCGFRKGRGCVNQVFTLRLIEVPSLSNTFCPQSYRL
ncbi:uncharacterized protein LOC136025570 [Artemia franciscana]|uniref:uncharacterized protein LOC136025570 n=1 Tax=Artemia franciscana TaxID=6661 RepID=UPI0032DA9FC2